MGLDNICTKQISIPLSSCLASVPIAPLPPNPTLIFNRQVWRAVTAPSHHTAAAEESVSTWGWGRVWPGPSVAPQTCKKEL